MSRPADSGVVEQKRIIIGRISGLYGVSGWVRVESYSRPRRNIFSYSSWQIGRDGEWETRELVEGREPGKGMVARLQGVDDRDQARNLIGMDIAIFRDQMPELPEGEFYWCDLLDMEVVNLQGESLGRVTGIRETGANDVLEVTGRRRVLIPLIPGRHVEKIDLDQAKIVVDWDPGR